MKEFNHEVAMRKFYQTYLFYKKDGELKNSFCQEISLQGHSKILYHLKNGDVTDDPLYHYIPAGFYEMSGTKHIAIVTKIPIKQWKIGLHSSHIKTTMITEDGPIKIELEHINFLKQKQITPTIVKESIDSFGPITNNIFLSNDSIFYLHKKIGVRKENKVIVDPFTLGFLQLKCPLLTKFNPT